MPATCQADDFHFTITRQQAGELANLAGNLYAEAERCSQASRWTAALMLISGSAEAALLATACVFEPELRNMGLWSPPKNDPTRWTLGQLAEIARKAGWLPSVQPSARSEIFADLDGQAGDALRFVERLRNMIIHPGAYVRETLRPDIGNEQHLQLTYQLIDGILAQVFEHLSMQMNTLAIDAETTDADAGRAAHTSETKDDVRPIRAADNRHTQVDQIWPASTVHQPVGRLGISRANTPAAWH